MNNNENITLITRALDIEGRELFPETELASLDEWDSMGKVSIIALLNIRDVDEVKTLETVQDILDRMS